IVIIAFVVYKLFSLLKNTRAEQVLKGFILVLVFASFADIFNLNTVSWLMNQFLTVTLIFIIVVFQPELRSALERLGRGRTVFIADSAKKNEKTIDEIVWLLVRFPDKKLELL